MQNVPKWSDKQASHYDLDSLPEPILTISDILEGYRNETLV